MQYIDSTFTNLTGFITTVCYLLIYWDLSTTHVCLEHIDRSVVRNYYFILYYVYRFEIKLPEIFKDIHEAYEQIEARLKAEQFKVRVNDLMFTWWLMR